MDMRKIGHSDLSVSTLGLGCNNFGGRLDEAGSVAVVHAALNLGVNLFDTADVYPMGGGGASEEVLGRALGAHRQNVVIATKFGMRVDADGKAINGGGSRDYIVASVEAALQRLGTDWIDLLQFHKPDPSTPIEETLGALDHLIQSGKVRYVGSSQFAAWQSVEADFIARELGAHKFICTQAQYSLLARDVEREVIPVLKKYGIGLLPFFPLASGVLTGKYVAGEAAPLGSRLANSQLLAGMFLSADNLALADALGQVAKASGKELIDLAFAWLLRDSVVPSVIAGASTSAQVTRNGRAVEWVLSAAEIDAVAKALA